MGEGSAGVEVMVQPAAKAAARAMTERVEEICRLLVK
jgi:hypothetical protein